MWALGIELGSLGFARQALSRLSHLSSTTFTSFFPGAAKETDAFWKINIRMLPLSGSNNLISTGWGGGAVSIPVSPPGVARHQRSSQERWVRVEKDTWEQGSQRGGCHSGKASSPSAEELRMSHCELSCRACEWNAFCWMSDCCSIIHKVWLKKGREIWARFKCALRTFSFLSPTVVLVLLCRFRR